MLARYDCNAFDLWVRLVEILHSLNSRLNKRESDRFWFQLTQRWPISTLNIPKYCLNFEFRLKVGHFVSFLLPFEWRGFKPRWVNNFGGGVELQSECTAYLVSGLLSASLHQVVVLVIHLGDGARRFWFLFIRDWRRA